MDANYLMTLILRFFQSLHRTTEIFSNTCNKIILITHQHKFTV